MSVHRYLRPWCVHALAFLLASLVSVSPGLAQNSSIWTGTVRELGAANLQQRSLSADGRFLVMETVYPAVPDDSNGVDDVYVRDRQSGTLWPVSVAADGSFGNGASGGGVISADGRHVLFSSVASNLDPADDNTVSEIFVRNLETSVTTLLSVGPNGERAQRHSGRGRLSGDGRFAAFVADFNTGQGSAVWLRDRDTDANGVFDESDGTSTILISPRVIDGYELFEPSQVAISNDGRYIAFSSQGALNYSIIPGYRMYLHDRQTGTTNRIDKPISGADEVETLSVSPDFSESGELVYCTNAPNLTADDSDAFSDVLVYNVATGTQSRLQLSHITAQFDYTFGAQISADGRYVAFSARQIDAAGTEQWGVFAVDRLTQQSYDVARTVDGDRDSTAIDPAMNADGSVIAFVGGQRDVRDATGGSAVYVTTALAVSPHTIEMSLNGGAAAVEVSVPPDIAWTAKLVHTSPVFSWAPIGTYSGVGSTTLVVEIPQQYEEGEYSYEIWLGSEAVAVHQRARPSIESVIPRELSSVGGERFFIFGSGFQAGAIVTLGGVAATELEIDSSSIRGVYPAHAPAAVEVVVTNPDGVFSVDRWIVGYFDGTPPVITPHVSGTLGANGWYTSDVTVDWTVEDPDSELTEVACPIVSQTVDTPGQTASCSASSGYSADTVRISFKRDATSPEVVIHEPRARSYRQGESISVDVACSDQTSGIASCSGSQAGLLDTSTPGSFTFTATAIDRAGHTVTHAVDYIVRAAATLDVSPAAGTYGAAATLRSVLVSGSVPLANRNVSFIVEGAVVATAVTDQSGVAATSIALGSRAVGALTLQVEFAGDDTTSPAMSNTTALSIIPAQLRVTVNNATKVYGEALPAFSLGFEGFVNGDTISVLSGLASFATSATASSAPGQYRVTAAGYSASNYAITFGEGLLTILKASTMASLVTSPDSSHNNQSVVVTATVTAVAAGAGMPTGTFELRDNGTLLGSGPVVNGVGSATIRFKKGSHQLTVSYSGDANFAAASATVIHNTN